LIVGLGGFLGSSIGYLIFK